MSSIPALYQMFTEPYEAYMHGSTPRLVKGHDYAIVEQVGAADAPVLVFVGVGVCWCVGVGVHLRVCPRVLWGIGSSTLDSMKCLPPALASLHPTPHPTAGGTYPVCCVRRST